MNLKEEIIQSIRQTVVAEVMNELRLELIDNLRDQARDEILDEMDAADARGLEDEIKSALLDEYFEENCDVLIKEVKLNAESVVKKLDKENISIISEAVGQFRIRISNEVEFAAATLKAEMKDEMKKIAEELRADFRALNSDLIRSELKSVVHEILTGRNF
jgi:hypothetical protein